MGPIYHQSFRRSNACNKRKNGGQKAHGLIDGAIQVREKSYGLDILWINGRELTVDEFSIPRVSSEKIEESCKTWGCRITVNK
jgi:hypothetical protein